MSMTEPFDEPLTANVFSHLDPVHSGPSKPLDTKYFLSSFRFIIIDAPQVKGHAHSFVVYNVLHNDKYV